MLGFLVFLCMIVEGVMGVKIAAENCVHFSDAKEAG